MKAVADHLTAARRLLDRGPLDHYFAKLTLHSETLLTKFAPFQIGDEVKIVGAVDCHGDWIRIAKSLEVGSIGLVTGLDYTETGFVIDFQPHIQYFERYGDWHVAPDDSYTYRIKAAQFELANQPCEPNNWANR